MLNNKTIFILLPFLRIDYIKYIHNILQKKSSSNISVSEKCDQRPVKSNVNQKALSFRVNGIFISENTDYNHKD